MPKTLKSMVRKRLEADPELPWDQVVAEVAARNCKKRGDLKSERAS
jgi:hypothetical protein